MNAPRTAHVAAYGPLAAPAPENRRSPFRTIWDDLGYLHDHPMTGDRLDGCVGCSQRSADDLDDRRFTGQFDD